jgi:hypothetical protein
MKTFEVKVTAVVKLPKYRIKVKQGDRHKDIIVTLWRLTVSYLAKEEVYEMELQEPLRKLACTEYSIGIRGLAEFDLSANPPVKAGDRIQIDAYEPGERVRDDGVL